jgi:hypothetical protein
MAKEISLTLKLADQHLNRLRAATTPEEAAQIFMRAATDGLAQVVSDAVAKAASAQLAHTLAGAADWTKYILHSQLEWHWTTPDKLVPGALASLGTSKIAGTGPQAQAIGVDVSVGIHGTF